MRFQNTLKRGIVNLNSVKLCSWLGKAFEEITSVKRSQKRSRMRFQDI